MPESEDADGLGATGADDGVRPVGVDGVLILFEPLVASGTLTAPQSRVSKSV